MRVLGWVLAGALALTTPIVVQAGSLGPGYIQCQTVGTVTGVEHPLPRTNGTADGFRVTERRTVFPAGGFAVRGRGCLRTGSGVPAAGPLIIPLPIGEARRVAGVIRSQPGARSLSSTVAAVDAQLRLAPSIAAATASGGRAKRKGRENLARPVQQESLARAQL
jgi:hypothetical protein